MEKKNSSPIHGGNNVIPFTREKTPHSAGDNVTIEYSEVDVLLCSLCEGNSFYLLNDQTGQIGCSSCGYLTGSHWANK